MVKFNQDQGAWDADRMEHLRRLWDNGMSAAEIARILKTSRNSVIGKSHRMGLKARPHPIRDRKQREYADGMTPEQQHREHRNKQQRDLVAKKKAAKSAPVIAVVAEAPSAPAEKPKPRPYIKPPRIVLPEPAGPLTLEQAQERNGCRWPSGHRPDMTFCGKNKAKDIDPDTSYCEDHLIRSIGRQPLGRLRAA